MERYVVKRVVQETTDVRTIHFTRHDGSHPDFMPGQFVTVQFDDLGTPEGKAYSLSSIPTDDFLSITVKDIGLYSNRLCSFKEGDSFIGSQPYGFLFEDTGASLICIVAGVGISPIWSVIRSVLREDQRRDISLICSNKTLEDIVFSAQMEEMLEQYPNLTIEHHITRSQDVRKTDEIVRITALDITYYEDTFKKPEYLLCGSEDFVRAIYHMVRSLDVSEDRISTETFF